MKDKLIIQDKERDTEYIVTPVSGRILRQEAQTETFTKLYSEEDPHGVSQHDAGAKLDAGKPDCSLLLMFGKALLAVAEVGTLGAEKYTRGGWQEVANGITRYTAALLRHLWKEQDEDYDRDLHVLHASQVAWNSLARLELILREREDAKPKQG